MKNKLKEVLLVGAAIGFIFLLPNVAFADDASTTPDITPPEISTTDDIDLNSVMTTENGELFFIEESEPLIDMESIIDESEEEQIDDVPLGTYISGDVIEDQTWIKANGPYYISDIYIGSGVTVTVEAGTQIFVDGYVAVYGNLVLNGSEDDKIIMDLNPDYSSWYIYLDAFANLNFNNVLINHIDGITTRNGFINFTDVDYRDATDGIVLNHFGSIVGERVNFEGGELGVQVVAVDNSTINLRNSIVDNGTGENQYILQGYRGSKVNISSSKIITSFAVPIIMLGGVLNLDTTLISGGDGNGIELFSDSSSGSVIPAKAIITNTTLQDFLGDGIFAIDPDMTITDSKILNNNVGIESYARINFNLSVANSTVVGNATGMVFGVQDESANINFDVRNNWWGDKSGPYFEDKNDLGFGDEIVWYTEFARNKIQFEPWLLKEPNKRNPVIIIPGVMGSYLNKDDEDKTEVWPNALKALLPGSDNYLNDLILSVDEESGLENIITVDIIRSIHEHDFSSGLITKLKAEGYKEGEDLFVFPYDWRFDVEDIVNEMPGSQAESLEHKIDAILADSKSEQVDIVAHSTGGLLAKYYIKHIDSNKLGKFVDIGTPHFGAPKAEKVLVYGDNMDIKFGALGLNPLKIKEISQNFPSAYNLLPSQKYFDSTLPDYSYYLYDLGDVDGDGTVGRLSYDNTKSFLKNTGRNELLLQNAETMHNDLDDFDPEDYGVDSYNIVGCGAPTIGKIFANNKKSKEEYEYQLLYISGDGTVPQRSAEGMSSDKLFYATDIQHATMPSQRGIRNLVASILGDNVDNFDYGVNSNIKTNTDNCQLQNGKIISIHSPVALHIYDDLGNHTGPDENGDIEYGIADVTYDTLEGNKFAFIPDGLNYTIKFNATGLGVASIDVQDYTDGEINQSESFYDIEIGDLNTKGEIVVGEIDSKVIIDKSGDGQMETLNADVKIQGGLPEEGISNATADIVPHESSNASGFKSGSAVAREHLSIPIFKDLSEEIVENKDPVMVQNIPVQEKVTLVASSSPKEEVELKDTDTSQLASPAGFFGNIVSAVWKFISELFNKIINLFK